MSSIPLPALAVKAPEQPDLLGQVGKMMSLKSMLGQQQIQQQTIQENDLNLKDQQAMRALAPKYVTKDSSGQVTGYDTEGFANAALSAGVSPKTVTGLREQQAKATKDFADAGAAKLKLEKDKNENSYQVLEGVRSEKDPVARGQAYQQGIAKLSQMGTDVSKFPQDHVPTDDELTQYEIPLGMHGQAITDAGKIQEAEKNKAQARMDNANAALKEIETQGLQALTPESISQRVDSVFDPKDPTSAGQNRMLKAMTLGALQQGDLPGAQKILQDGFQKAIAAQSQIQVDTDPRVQANKIEVAKAEGIARQAIEGVVKPVYAVDGTGTKTLMSQTDAVKSGAKLTIPVTEKQVSDDAMLINRLGDVHQKLARYEQAFNTPISASDRYVMSKVLADDKFKLGGFGAEIPVDFLNKLDQARNLGNLSPEAQKRLISYYNQREAMTGYNRVLSGSGKSSDKNLELQLETMPSPIAPDDYGKQAFIQFRENLGVVGQGLPKIAGVKSPEEIEAQVTGGGKPQGGKPGAVSVGQKVTIRGKQMKVTAVHPDGTFDAQ